MSDQLTFTNPKVQRLRRLIGRRSARVDEGAFVVEGASLVAEAARAGWHIEAIFVAPGAAGMAALADAVPSGDVRAPVFELAQGVLERVASTEHPQPVLAVVRARRATLAGLGTPSLVVIADRLGDPGNAGTILRSAEAAGADAVVLTAGSVDPFNPKVVRASAGALFHIAVVTDVSLGDALGLPGLRTIGTSSHQGSSYTATDLRPPTGIVLGSEADGLDPTVAVDEWVTIPHAGRAESLNVAMAATVLLFEAARQRNEPLPDSVRAQG